MKKIVIKFGMVGMISILLSFSGSANVSLKNGNYFVGFTDVLYSGGFEPKVERVYNSKTQFAGIFGVGWGSEYEVNLSVSADGSVVAHEYGGGAENRFVPVGFTRIQLEKAVDNIISAAKNSGALGGKSQEKSYREKLLKDSIFRNDEWQKFVSQKKLKPVVVSDGTKFTSNRFSFQYLVKTKTGYTRIFENGKREDFDNIGRLEKVSDKNSNFILFSYQKNGKLQALKDNFNRKMFFEFNEAGLLSKVSALNNQTAEYWYNKAGLLVKSKDSAGNVYQYEYDSNYNMTAIEYSDKTKMKISYYNDNYFRSVKGIQDRDGTLTEYKYDWKELDKGNLKVWVNVKSKEGTLLSKNYYEYFLKYKATGEEWTERLVTDINGIKTDTTYNECCGLPLKIVRGKEVTEFKYDPKGRVTYKETPLETASLKYNDKAGKVSYVNRFSKLTKKKKWSKFDYDAKGNLTKALNSDKKVVQLFYDRFGRIATLYDVKTKQKIDFEYNEHSRPIKITDSKNGTISVAYSNTGQIKKVDSKGGRSVAMEVTSAFQNLLDIIRPAGVELSF